MSDLKNKYLQEISDFFLEGNNWEMALHTVEAVNEITAFWVEMFWRRVAKRLESSLPVENWHLDVQSDRVYIYAINRGKVLKNCLIDVSCDDEDNGYFGVWFEKNVSFHKKSNNYKQFAEIVELDAVERCDSSFYISNVIPNLYEKLGDRNLLIKVIKNDFEEAERLAEKTVDFVTAHKLYNRMIQVTK